MGPLFPRRGTTPPPGMPLMPSTTPPPPQLNHRLAEYKEVVGDALVLCGDHMALTGLKLGMFLPREALCPPTSRRHPWTMSSLAPLLRAH